jgi:hypothetical protein
MRALGIVVTLMVAVHPAEAFDTWWHAIETHCSERAGSAQVVQTEAAIATTAADLAGHARCNLAAHGRSKDPRRSRI